MPDRTLPGRFGALSVPGHHPDPDESTDPHIRSVLVALRSLPAPEPDPTFRAELRSQLVAIAPRLVAEGISTDATPAAATGGRPSRRPSGLRRPLAALASAATVAAVLLGVAVWKSNDSVPGDTLYGLKRADENVQLSLTGGDGAKGKAYLDQAQNRADETLSLWTDSVPGTDKQVVATGDGATADRMEQALAEADADVRQGARLIGESVVSGLSADALTAMLQWAPGQIDRLTEIAASIPPGSLRSRAIDSVLLVQHALDRAQALAQEVQSGCQCLTSAPADEFGPMPCPICSSTSPAQPGPPATTTPAVPGSPSGSGGSGEPGSGAPSGSDGSSDSTPAPSSDSSSDTSTSTAPSDGGAGQSGAGAGAQSPAPTPPDPAPSAAAAAAPAVPAPAAPAPAVAAPAAPAPAAPAPEADAPAPAIVAAPADAAAAADPAPPADAAAVGPDPAPQADTTAIVPASDGAASVPDTAAGGDSITP